MTDMDNMVGTLNTAVIGVATYKTLGLLSPRKRPKKKAKRRGR